MNFLDSIAPIVLVGGRSSRFGRDKLREPVSADGGVWLVDLPVRVLRGVFGERVVLVGACDPEVARRGDRHVPDKYPGAGPLGGVLTALEATGRGVFVLAGDIPGALESDVRAVLAEAERAAEATAVLAGTPGGADGERLAEPCFGLYRPAAIPVLKLAIEGRELTLKKAAEALGALVVPLDRGPGNVNRPEDLEV